MWLMFISQLQVTTVKYDSSGVDGLIVSHVNWKLERQNNFPVTMIRLLKIKTT